MARRLVSVVLSGFAFACVSRAVVPASEPPTRAVAVEPPRCPRTSSEAPAMTAGRLHVQSSAPLSCPAIVDPRGERVAVCAGGGVAVLDLDSGRELIHVPARAGAWGWDASGGLLVARDSEQLVEIVRIDPGAFDPQAQHRATIEITGLQRLTLGLSRHGELVTWLRHPLSSHEPFGRSWHRYGEPPPNALYWRGLEERATHELELREPAELLWAIDGRSYAYVIDGEQRVTDAATDEVLARWTGGLLHGYPRSLELPMTGGRGGESRYGRVRRAIVGLGRTHVIHHDANGRLWVSARKADGEFVRRLALDEIPRSAWFEGFSPNEDAAVFRVSTKQPSEEPYVAQDDELLLVSLDTGRLLAARSFPEQIDSATVVDPRCGVLVIASGDPIWWPTDVPDAPTRRLGLPRTYGPSLAPLQAQVPSPNELSIDYDKCTATLEREGQSPVTLRWPAAPDGSAAKHCSDVLVDPTHTRALLMTRDPPSGGVFDRYELAMYWPWRRLRASMFALDGKRPERALWTRTLPETITAANFVDGELLLASGAQHSTMVRMSIEKGRVLGRTPLPEYAAIVAFVQVDGGFVALTNDPYTRWWGTEESRQAGIFSALGPDRPEPLHLRGFDAGWTERWATPVRLSLWDPSAGWFPVLDRSGTCLQVDAQDRYLIFDEHAGATLAAVNEDGIRWIETHGRVELTHDRQALLVWNAADSVELRALSPEPEPLWQLATYGDRTWIRWRDDEVLDHSPGDAWQMALNRVGNSN